VPAAAVVRAAQVQVVVLLVMETPSAAAELARVTAELARLPPVTPRSFPALMTVAPL
jgi:hypothetical protein